MMAWTTEQLREIVAADDLHVAPLRGDHVTHGTPTWVWCVAVDDALYVRAYNGPQSRWYAAAVSQGAGRIMAAGKTFDVSFEAAGGSLDERIDAAYRVKYDGSPYLAPMVAAAARAATVRITPQVASV